MFTYGFSNPIDIIDCISISFKIASNCSLCVRVHIDQQVGFLHSNYHCKDTARLFRPHAKNNNNKTKNIDIPEKGPASVCARLSDLQFAVITKICLCSSCPICFSMECQRKLLPDVRVVWLSAKIFIYSDWVHDNRTAMIILYFKNYMGAILALAFKKCLGANFNARAGLGNFRRKWKTKRNALHVWWLEYLMKI